MSRTEKGTSTSWRAWCRRNLPATPRMRREVIAERVDARQVHDEIEGAEMDARMPECDGVGCELCSDESWREEPLPVGVTVQPADELRVVIPCQVKLGGVVVRYPLHVTHMTDLELEDPDVWDDHSDCEQCTGYSDRDDEEITWTDMAPDGYPAERGCEDRGVRFGALEDQALEAPCYGCRRGLRRAAVHDVEPGDPCAFTHVHLLRSGVTIECTGTAWRLARILSEDDDEQAQDLPG